MSAGISQIGELKYQFMKVKRPLVGNDQIRVTHSAITCNCGSSDVVLLAKKGEYATLIECHTCLLGRFVKASNVLTT